MDDETRRIVDSTMIGEAVESLPLAVFVSDAALNYLAVNAAAAALVGVPRGALLERRVGDVVASPYAELREAAEAAEVSGAVSGEAVLRREDGTRVDVLYTTMAARIGNLPVLVSFVRAKAVGEVAPVDVLGPREVENPA